MLGPWSYAISFDIVDCRQLWFGNAEQDPFNRQRLTQAEHLHCQRDTPFIK